MNKLTFKKIAAFAAVSVLMVSASANSISFSQASYFSGTGGVVTVLYDYSDFPMFGGGFDLVYDPQHLSFVSYTQAELAPDAEAPASPIGFLASDGLYSGAGMGTFDFNNGMSSSGVIGTFVFNVLGGGMSQTTPCGQSLCLVPNAINPFVSLAGEDVTTELIANGISAAGFVAKPEPVPVPAAVWLMLGGLGALFGIGRKTAS